MEIYIKDIYRKIIEQSKKKFFFETFFVPNEPEAKIEIFQLNLIIVLWFMKKKQFKEKYITYLISIFLKDLELLLFEIGEAESRVPKKMRKMTENFYGRLISYSKQFDRIISEKKDSLIIKKLQANFNNTKINYNKYSKYLERNIKHFYKLEQKDFGKLTFCEI